MLIQHHATEGAFLASLTTGDDTILPVYVRPEHRALFAETVDPLLADAAPQEVRDWPVHSYTRGLSELDLVSGAPGQPSGALARRYARCLDREFTPLRDDDLLLDRDVPDGATLTVFVPESVPDPFYWYTELRRWCGRGRDAPVPTGLLAASDLETLSWVVLKQLLAQAADPRRDQAALLVDCDAGPYPVLHDGDQEVTCQSLDELRERLSHPIETLFITGHGPPHCGAIAIGGEWFGYCTAAPAEQGPCFDGKDCCYGSGNPPRIIATSVRCERLFYNGCFTSSLGSNSFGIPRHLNVAFAALRGYARDVIGNIRAGRYTSSDMWSLVTLSDLGFRPAEAVEMLDRIRSAELREQAPSLVYLGDAANPPWTTGIAGMMRRESAAAGVVVTAEDVKPVLGARLPTRRWADLSRRDLLDVLADPDAEGTLIPSPWTDESILIVFPSGSPEPGPARVELAERDQPIDRSAGCVLEKALDNIRFLARLDDLRPALDGAVEAAADWLTGLRAQASNRRSVVGLANALSQGRELEPTLASAFDGAIVAEACRRASTFWNWGTACAPYLTTRPTPDVESCPLCGSVALVDELSDLLTGSLRWRQVICTQCSVVKDLPVWDLNISLDPRATEKHGDAWTAGVAVQNCSGRRRTAVVALQVHGRTAIGGGTTATVDIAPHAEEKVTLHFRSAGLRTGFTWFRLYVASEAGFGFVGGPLVT